MPSRLKHEPYMYTVLVPLISRSYEPGHSKKKTCSFEGCTVKLWLYEHFCATESTLELTRLPFVLLVAIMNLGKVASILLAKLSILLN